jgi:hypothetical protein
VAEAELEAADSYFDKMEKRDEMESKMLSTFEMKTKAVTCHVCNYTSFKVLGTFCFSFLSEPVFVNLLRHPGIDSQPGGPVRKPYLSYWPAMLHRLAESNPRNPFLVFL